MDYAKKFWKTKFLTEQGEKNLVAYKYVGSDASLLYKHFFSPVAQFLVDKVIPIWLAPNLITLIGFSCTLLPHLIILSMFPSELAGPVPRWLCIFAAVGQFLYMNLDNADGKQARKTGSSSPLGLLFDHGCDALNTFISGLSLFTVMELGNTPLAIIADIIAMATFYMATWEEYYVEGLHLPIVNGANEGQAGVIFFYLFTGVVGTDFWTKSIGPIQFNVVAIAIFAIMALVTIVGNIMNVRKKNTEKFASAVFNLITISYIVITMFIVSYCSLTDVISRTARPFIYFIGFSFGKLVGHVQVDHVAHQDFKQFKRSIYLSLTILNINTLYGHFAGQTLLDEDAIVYLCLAIALVAYAHFVVNIISEFTRVLRIYVFKIGVKPAGGMDIESLDTTLIEDIELRGSTDNLDV